MGEIVVQPSRGASLPTAVRDLIQYREIVLALMRRSIKVRYKQAALGAMWALIQPLAYLTIFSIVFEHITRAPSTGGLHYTAFLLTALIPWQFVSTAVPLGLNSLVAEAPLLRKAYLPREAIIVGALGPALVDLVLGLALLFCVEPILGGRFGVAIAFVPVLILVLALPVFGISFAVAALNAYYRDFRLAVPLAVQVWMFASPIVYPLTAVSARWRTLYAAVNPLVGPLDGFRRSVGLGVRPDLGLLGISAASGTVVLLVGHRILKALEPGLADVV